MGTDAVVTYFQNKSRLSTHFCSGSARRQNWDGDDEVDDNNDNEEVTMKTEKNTKNMDSKNAKKA